VSNYSAFWVLSTRESRTLADHLAAGGSHEYGLSVTMREAARIFVQAELAGETVPIVFSNAEAKVMKLVYWGILDGVNVSDHGRWTKLSYTLVEHFKPPRAISSLTLKSVNRAVSDDFQREYAVCLRPSFIR
jgi:hypothetical protein